MQRLVMILIVLFLLLNNPATGEDAILPLKLIKALPVEGPERIEPSGLTIFDGTLFTVSDKHSDTIFRIQLSDDKAVLVPYVKFDPPDKRLDFEGITRDENGDFYLVSEKAFRILQVSKNGDNASWISPDLRPCGEDVGLFETSGAYLEGIALVGENKFAVCAERQPRGIIEVDLTKMPYEAEAFNCNMAKVEPSKDRNPDFTGLFFEDGVLYVLQRYACVISKLIRNEEGFAEKDFWSYEAAVTSDELRYSDMTFGKAEGLCMDRDRVYVIIDNNREQRYSDPADRRPLLLIMERP